MTLDELTKKYGSDLKTWVSGSKLRTFGPARHLGIQSEHFDRLGVNGCWGLASTLRLPVKWIEERDPW